MTSPSAVPLWTADTAPSAPAASASPAPLPAPPVTAVPLGGPPRPTLVASLTIATSDLPGTALPTLPTRAAAVPLPAKATPVDLRSPFGVLASLGAYRAWWRGGALTCRELDMLGTSPPANTIACGERLAPLEPARFEAPVLRADGRVGELAVADGWFDVRRCASHVERRARAAVKEIVARSLYGFVACGARCAADDDVVLIVLGARNVVGTADVHFGGKPLPDGGSEGGFARVTLPRGRGSQSVVADLPPRAAEPWIAAAKLSSDVARSVRAAGIVVTVEVGAESDVAGTTALVHVAVPASAGK